MIITLFFSALLIGGLVWGFMRDWWAEELLLIIPGAFGLFFCLVIILAYHGDGVNTVIEYGQTREAISTIQHSENISGEERAMAISGAVSFNYQINKARRWKANPLTSWFIPGAVCDLETFDVSSIRESMPKIEIREEI